MCAPSPAAEGRGGVRLFADSSPEGCVFIILVIRLDAQTGA
jgi:hypothetical protein